MLEIGGKYKINKVRLKQYSDELGWDYKSLSLDGYVTVTRLEMKAAMNVKCYNIREGTGGYYPEDCLTPLKRREILERLLR